MKRIIGRARLDKHYEKPQRVEILIKIENDTDIPHINTNQHEVPTIPIHAIIKAEENSMELKCQLPRPEGENGYSSHHLNGSKNYCIACDKKLSDNTSYNKHIRSLAHKRKINMKLLTPDIFDPYNYCKTCSVGFAKLKKYRQLLRGVHKMKLTPLQPVPDPSIIPDPNNTSNYCDSCKWTFTRKAHYHYHLETVHKMDMPKKQKRATPNPNISPDIDYPNFYCKSCNIQYTQRGLYRRHLKRVHKIELAPLRKQAIPDTTISLDDMENPNNTSCTICNFVYRIKQSYQKHMKKYHSDGGNTPVSTRGKTTINPNIQPDPLTRIIFVAHAKGHTHVATIINITFAHSIQMYNTLLQNHLIL